MELGSCGSKGTRAMGSCPIFSHAIFDAELSLSFINAKVTKTIENRIDHESRPTVSTFVWRSCQVIFLVSKISLWRFGETQQAHTRSRFTREVAFQRSLWVCYALSEQVRQSVLHKIISLIIQPLRTTSSQVSGWRSQPISSFNRISSHPPPQASHDDFTRKESKEYVTLSFSCLLPW